MLYSLFSFPSLIYRIVVKRSEAITREMNRKLADDKKMSKKEKDERILWKKNEVSVCKVGFSLFSSEIHCKNALDKIEWQYIVILKSSRLSY